MRIDGIIWLREVVDKLASKHRVEPDEVEQVLYSKPKYRFIEKGDVEAEHLYAALGQTDSGRYLVVYFVFKATGEALVVSAREMTKKEQRKHGK